jgi:AraC-like DNA-binding protein
VVLSGVMFNLCVMNAPIFAGGLARFKVLLLFYTSISFFISLTMQEIFNFRFRYSSVTLTALFCAVAAAILAAPSTRVLIEYSGLASVLTVLVFQAYSCLVFVRAVLQIPRKYWLLVFLAPVVISAFRNTYYLLTMQFSVVQQSIFLHVPVVIYIATLFFFYDYEYEKRSGESIYRSLLKKSQKLKRDLDKAKKIDAKPEPHEKIHELIEYLDENFSETYDREELSRKFGLNSNYMVQLFKRTTGDTISNYINMKRIDSARSLLRDSENKIIDIAYHVGFENYTHFHRLFKRVTGMTPREYRIYSEE